jgi:peptidoglycan-associated lipoprotein
MKARVLRLAGLLAVLSLTLLVGACHKKSAAVTPPPSTAPAAQPTATLSAIPPTVQKGESVQLKWSTENASQVTIDALGKVASEGSQSVSPSDSTTYTLTATGPGGSAQATASVTVKVAAAATATHAAGNALAKGVKDVYFDFDRYDLRPADLATLQTDADFLSAHGGDKVTIAGHCDERGSEEYNLALGVSRANAVSAKLESLGVASQRLKTVSYGKEKPFCTEHDEACWQQNRRAHLTLDE